MNEDEGFTLVEVLIALAILSIAAVALVGAMQNLVVSSSIHRGFSSTDALARAIVEDVEQQAQDASWTCTTSFASTVDTTGYQVAQTWNWIDATTGQPIPGSCSTFAAARCPAESSPFPAECTPGILRLQLTVTRAGDAAHSSVKTDTTATMRRANA